MTRLGEIEEAIKNAILAIDGTIQGSGYKYVTKTALVNVEDENVIFEHNDFNDTANAVAYNVEIDEDEENIEVGDGNDIYTNEIDFKITAYVKNTANEEFPKVAIRERCNEVKEDLKFAIPDNSALALVVNSIDYVRSSRKYDINSDNIRTANLEYIVNVNYSQLMTSPDKSC
jgi:hypothetical protein